MNENIRLLVQLQRIALEMRRLEQMRQEAPARLEELEERFRQRVEEIGAARLRHEELTEERTGLFRQRQEVMERLERAQQKLMRVTNQREYSAALNEIDINKAALAGLEEKIAAAEEEIESLAGPAAEADEHIRVEREKTDADRKALEEELAEAARRLGELDRERQEITRRLDPLYLRRFEIVFKARDGVAMAAIENSACSACHVRLRPQVINLARRGEDLVTCDSCRRILYVPAAMDDAGPSKGEGAAPPGEPGDGVAGPPARSGLS
ncbi:MAG: hypothetical protein D6718_01395 [Acidobacteria bacterium]|nr:MAG: hypothetical protein D6718_01395 [Acidobacteriota bacterium]